MIHRNISNISLYIALCQQKVLLRLMSPYRKAMLIQFFKIIINDLKLFIVVNYVIMRKCDFIHSEHFQLAHNYLLSFLILDHAFFAKRQLW